MVLKLIPEDNTLLATPQPVAPTQIPDEMITEEHARAYLRALSTPRLDAFRAKIPTLKTSELIGCSIDLGHVASVVCITPITAAQPTDDDREALMAAMLAIGDEIDRRIPIP
jgi:hypothetical protein